MGVSVSKSEMQKSALALLFALTSNFKLETFLSLLFLTHSHSHSHTNQTSNFKLSVVASYCRGEDTPTYNITWCCRGDNTLRKKNSVSIFLLSTVREILCPVCNFFREYSAAVDNNVFSDSLFRHSKSTIARVHYI